MTLLTVLSGLQSDGSDGSDGPSGTAIPCDPLFETSTSSETLLGVEEHVSAYAEAVAGGVVDLLIGVPAPTGEQAEKYQKYLAQLRDRESKEDFTFPAQYMFKDVPEVRRPATTRSRCSSARWTVQHQRRHAQRVAPTSKRAARCTSTPTASSRAGTSTPTAAWRRCARSKQAVEQLGVDLGAGASPPG